MMRNLSRLVIAEDNRDIAALHRKFFSRVGGYEVLVTSRGSEILTLLENSGAGWLILDLELDDGPAAGLVPKIRERFGQDLFLLILTGYWDTYTEKSLFSRGVDDVLRKPHRPEDIYARMQRLVERLEGARLAPKSIPVLRIGDTTLHLGKSLLVRGNERMMIPDSYVQLLNILARRDAAGWQVVHRADLLVHLWGESIAEDPDSYGDRLRTLVHRVRDLVGAEVILARRGRNKSSCYCLSEEVTVEE